MKKIIPTLFLAFLLSSCNGWIIQPLPYTPPTPFLPFTQTPSVFTATPVVIGVSSSTPAVITFTPSVTTFPTFTPTNTPPGVVNSSTPSATDQPGAPAISVKVLGCNTSIDITHGMGEVTNAFVTLKNTGGVALTNIRATLLALDPGQQVHPDQTVELVSLPISYQVTIKLTVDSTFQQETPIQVEMKSDQGDFPREGAASCRDIGLLAPNPAGLNTPVPITP